MGEEFDMQRSGVSRPLALLVAGGCLFLGVLSSVAGAAAPMFITAPGSPLAADGPNWEGIADVDRDGRLDLAVANELTDSVSIRLGDGTGGFGAPTAVPVGDTPTSLALADFTRDGRLDMAVANPGSDNVTIHIGDGTGGFSAGSPIGLPDAPWYIEVGDVNRDKRLDLVVPHVGSIVGTSFVASHDVSILLGDGKGNFSPAPGSPLTVGRVPYGARIADLNGDKYPDLAIANQFDNYISILFGNGTGRFSEAPISPITVGAGPTWLTADDLNHDGTSDIAVAVASGTVAVLLGDGTGGFEHAPGSPISLSGVPHDMLAADFDRDGHLDLGVDRLGIDSFSVLLGDGAGGFSLASTTLVGDRPLSMGIGDVDGDGKLDVATGNYFGNSVSVLLNRTVTPSDTISSLRVDVLDSSVKEGLRTSLAEKLLAAERWAGLENAKACSKLNAFVQQVDAKTGSDGLTVDVAEEWIEAADGVREDLGCVA
jgi:FG-GAP-like repeat/FG-GAP repeat